METLLIADAAAVLGNFCEIIAMVCDFAIIAFVIYGLLYFFRGTKSAMVLFGLIVCIFLSYILADILKLKVTLELLKQFRMLLPLIFVVIFQPEIRRLLAQTGSIFQANGIFKNDNTSTDCINRVVNAVIQMSYSKTGAIIVFERKIGLDAIVKQSVQLNAEVNSLLLQTIFFKNSPLHDCAVIIRGNQIVAARGVLPILSNMEEDHNLYNPAQRLGTRHRAAIGVSMETDAVVVVVSEETGNFSIALNGALIRVVNAEELTNRLNDILAGKNIFQNMVSALQAKAAEKEELTENARQKEEKQNEDHT